MIIYNITSKVHVAISDAWLQWQLKEHIPEVMATGFFSDFRVLRLLEQDDTEGHTFAIQYHATDITAYEKYMLEHFSTMQQKAFKQWGGQTISFRSIMEVIQ